MAATLSHPLRLPRPPRARLRLAGLAARGRSVVRAALAPARPVLSNLSHVPLTVCACGTFDAAAFQGPTWLGLLAVTASLIYLEHVAADE